MANRVDSTIEHEFSKNTLVTGGSFVTMGEGSVFQAHTHFTTGGSLGEYSMDNPIS